MIQNVLREIGGIANYGILSICLFFTVFTAAMTWAFRLDGPYLKAMESLPLDPEPTESKLPQDQ